MVKSKNLHVFDIKIYNHYLKHTGLSSIVHSSRSVCFLFMHVSNQVVVGNIESACGAQFKVASIPKISTGHITSVYCFHPPTVPMQYSRKWSSSEYVAKVVTYMYITTFHCTGIYM